VLSHDQENDPYIVALIAASAALTLSGLPFMARSAPPASVYQRRVCAHPLITPIRNPQLDLVSRARAML